MKKTSDILILGGGIAGIGAGACLSAEAEVQVLEAEDSIGSHSTGRSAAIFILNYGNAVLRALNAVAEPVFLNPEGLADSSLLSARGELLVASEAELKDLEAYLDGATGIERLNVDEAVALCPILRPERFVAAAYEPNAQDIDVDRLFQGYARQLRARGGRIETKARAETITRADGVWTVQTAQGVYEAPVLINAAGAWADTVAEKAGLKPVGVTPYRRSAVTIPAPEGYDITRWPLVASASEDWYAKPEAGTLMISPADEDPVEPHDAWADDMVLAEGIDRFQQAVTIEVQRVLHSWAGLRSFAPDKTPVVGFDERADGFFWLAGQGGYGIQTAPALSQLAADLFLGKPPAVSVDVLSAMKPNRF